jgi:hypothetical protein
MPREDLLEDLIGRPVPGIDQAGTKPIRIGNLYERIYVAGYMLSDGSIGDLKRGMREAYDLYNGCGSYLLNKVGELTTADIVAEVMMLTASKEQQ